MPFASVYPHYVTKVERKGRTRADLHAALRWLTGMDEERLMHHVAAGTTFADLYAAARVPAAAADITGMICGYRVESIEDPFMKFVRQMDKLVDDLASGKKKTLRLIGAM